MCFCACTYARVFVCVCIYACWFCLSLPLSLCLVSHTYTHTHFLRLSFLLLHQSPPAIRSEWVVFTFLLLPLTHFPQSLRDTEIGTILTKRLRKLKSKKARTTQFSRSLCQYSCPCFLAPSVLSFLNLFVNIVPISVSLLSSPSHFPWDPLPNTLGRSLS